MTETQQHAAALKRYNFKSTQTRGEHPGTWQEFAGRMEAERDEWREEAQFQRQLNEMILSVADAKASTEPKQIP